MTNNELKLNDIYHLMVDFFGTKVSAPYINSVEQEITVILYDSFVFRFGIDERYQLFKGGILLDNKHLVTSFFGEKISINNDKKTILSNFKLVDKYCRLRLPDKFLKEYDTY
ncbi:MAG: hypothetical protein ACK5LC_10980 [Coprobacillaceae bacterium]